MNEYIVTPLSTQTNHIFNVTMCGISYPDGRYYIKRMNSNIFGIEYIMSGEGTVIADGQRYEVAQGDVSILKLGSNHEYFPNPQNPWQKIWLNASGTLTDSLLMAYNLNNYTVIRSADISHFLYEIIDINKCSGAKNDQNNNTAIVLHQILQFLHDSLITENTNISPEAVTLREYIEQRSVKSISIKELSQLIYRSESQTIRIFKSAFGMTPYDYLLNCRINHAKLLLKNTHMLIKEAAYKSGFSDEHYFSDIFKRKTGCTPKEYKMH